MKIKIAAVIATLMLVGTSTAFAEGGKYYGAIDLGSSTYSGANVSINGVGNTFPNPGVFSISGGYRFQPNFAIEVGYNGLGDSKLTGSTGDVTLSTKSVTVAAVGAYSLSKDFDLTGKLGFAANSFTEQTTGILRFADGSTSTSGSSSGVNYGIGGLYHATETIGVRFGYESFGTIATGVSSTAVKVGVTLDF